ncbi:Helicase-associated domain [Trinorchestia longiramus]|nr:Helicase-associated domain [Trinorchestia longiramus]
MVKVEKIKEKFRKRRNFKARHNVKTIIDTSEQDKIKVDLADKSEGSQYDGSNALVLPGQRRKTKKVREAEPVKLLSKKQRKRLQKIVDTKKKKAGREQLLDALEKIHASNRKKFPKLTSLQATQTEGRKKFLQSSYAADTAESLCTQNKGSGGASVQLGRNQISSSAKRKRKEDYANAKKAKIIKDPRVVYAGVSSSDSSDGEDEVSEIKKESSPFKCHENGSVSPDENITTVLSNTISESTNEKESSSQNHVESEKVEESSKQSHVLESKKAVESSNKSHLLDESSSTKSTAKSGSQINGTLQAIKRASATYVSVKRPAELAEARMDLPIIAEEQVVMETIKDNMMTVIVGPTGSGKTTQVPQFLYEAGFASESQIIGVTEPRRVAAVSMSERVGYELGLSPRQVSYQIRFEGNTTKDTKIKFMTDGVLLKEFQEDQLLLRYSAIIIDEAHERSVYSDLLIGILSRVAPARQKRGQPLKLIVMSATLRVEDFTENPWLFKKLGGPPPVVKIEGRTFPVTVHYNKKTDEDYLAAAYNKVCKIHRQLPDGAILVFVTGQQEVNQLCRKLRATFPGRGSQATEDNAVDDATEYRKRLNELKKRRLAKKEMLLKEAAAKEAEQENAALITKKLLEVKVDDFAAAASVFPDNENEANEEDDDVEDDDAEESGGIADVRQHEDDAASDDDDFELGDDVDADERKTGSTEEQPLHVLPLYSLLPSDRQKQVFQKPPLGTRLCVVATNVAETSLTIPNVKYVVDSGKTKDKVFDKVTGVSMFHVTNCCQASANQRAGRAGRVAPGHCYRLYSSAVFNDFIKFAKPEIMCRPIDDVVLILKNMNLPVVNFPYPTPPEHIQIRQSLKRLTHLGALREKDLDSGVTEEARVSGHDNSPIQKDTTVITGLGRLMSSFPVAPCYSKMLCLSDQFRLWPYTIALVAALTVQEILIEMPLDNSAEDFDRRRSEWRKIRLSWSGSGQSRLLGDLMVLLRAVLEADANNNTGHFCDQYGLRQKGLVNIRKLRRQLTNEVNMIVPGVDIAMNPNMKLPTAEQCCALRQVVLSGSVDRVARRVNPASLKSGEDKIRWKNAYQTLDLEEPVFLPHSSVLRIDKPEWVVYQDIFETHKMFMRGVTAIEPEWLSRFAPSLCRFSEPLARPAPYYDAEKDAVMCYADATYGRADWVLPCCLITHPPSTEGYSRFAYHFLKGDVFSELQPFAQHLVEFVTLLRPLALRYQSQKDALIRALKIYDAASRAKLLSIWKKQPNYLLREYCMWLSDQSLVATVSKAWPPVPKEVNEWLA